MFRQPFFYNRQRVSHPWGDMATFNREMNRLFDRVFVDNRARQTTAANFPAMNIWTNDDGAKLTANLAGVSSEDLDISVEGDTLTLSGVRHELELPEGTKQYRQERRAGEFSRTFQFPFNIEADHVEAKFDKGVLHVSLPRAEAEKPKKIAVQAV